MGHPHLLHRTHLAIQPDDRCLFGVLGHPRREVEQSLLAVLSIPYTQEQVAQPWNRYRCVIILLLAQARAPQAADHHMFPFKVGIRRSCASR